MIQIDAELPPDQEPAFISPIEALDAGARLDSIRQKGKGTELALGKTVLSGVWDNERVLFRLSGNEGLLLCCNNNVVDWLVKKDPVEFFEQAALNRTIVSIHLKGTQFLWDRGGLMERIVGKNISAIRAGKSVVFLRFREIRTICFNVLINAATGKPFLFWEEV